MSLCCTEHICLLSFYILTEFFFSCTGSRERLRCTDLIHIFSVFLFLRVPRSTRLQMKTITRQQTRSTPSLSEFRITHSKSKYRNSSCCHSLFCKLHLCGSIWLLCKRYLLLFCYFILFYGILFFNMNMLLLLKYYYYTYIQNNTAYTHTHTHYNTYTIIIFFLKTKGFFFFFYSSSHILNCMTYFLLWNTK